jgi:hypothetical protein
MPTKLDNIKGGAGYLDHLNQIDQQTARNTIKRLYAQLGGTEGTRSGVLFLRNANGKAASQNKDLVFERKSWYQRGFKSGRETTAEAMRVLFKRAGLDEALVDSYLRSHDNSLGAKSFKELLGSQLALFEAGVQQQSLNQTQSALEKAELDMTGAGIPDEAKARMSHFGRLAQELEAASFGLKKYQSDIVNNRLENARGESRNVLNQLNKSICETLDRLHNIQAAAKKEHVSLQQGEVSRELQFLEQEIDDLPSDPLSRIAKLEALNQKLAICKQMPQAAALKAATERLDRSLTSKEWALPADMLQWAREIDRDAGRPAPDLAFLEPALRKKLESAQTELRQLTTDRSDLELQMKLAPDDTALNPLKERLTAIDDRWEVCAKEAREALGQCEHALKQATHELEKNRDAGQLKVRPENKRWDFKNAINFRIDDRQKCFDRRRQQIESLLQAPRLSDTRLKQWTDLTRANADVSTAAAFVRDQDDVGSPLQIGRWAAARWRDDSASLAQFALQAYPPPQQIGKLAICLSAIAGLDTTRPVSAEEPAIPGARPLEALLLHLPDDLRPTITSTTLNLLSPYPINQNGDTRFENAVHLPAGSVLNLSTRTRHLRRKLELNGGLSATDSVIRLGGNSIKLGAGQLKNCRLVLDIPPDQVTDIDLNGLSLDGVKIDIDHGNPGPEVEGYLVCLAVKDALSSLPTNQGSVAADLLQQLESFSYSEGVVRKHTQSYYQTALLTAIMRFRPLPLTPQVQARIESYGGVKGLLEQRLVVYGHNVLQVAEWMLEHDGESSVPSLSPSVMKELNGVIQQKNEWARQDRKNIPRARELRDRLMQRLDFSQPDAPKIFASQEDLHTDPAWIDRLLDASIDPDRPGMTAAFEAIWNNTLDSEKARQLLLSGLLARAQRPDVLAICRSLPAIGEAFAEARLLAGGVRAINENYPELKTLLVRKPWLLFGSSERLRDCCEIPDGRRLVVEVLASLPSEKIGPLLAALKSVAPDLAQGVEQAHAAFARPPWSEIHADPAAIATYAEQMQQAGQTLSFLPASQGPNLARLFVYGQGLDAQGPDAALKERIEAIEQIYLKSPGVVEVVESLETAGLATRENDGRWSLAEPFLIHPAAAQQDGEQLHLIVTADLMRQALDDPGAANWDQALVLSSKAGLLPEGGRRRLVPQLLAVQPILSQAFSRSDSGFVSDILPILPLSSEGRALVSQAMLRKSTAEISAINVALAAKVPEVLVLPEGVSGAKPEDWPRCALNPEHLSSLRLWAEQQGVASSDRQFGHLLFSLSATMARLSGVEGLGRENEGVSALRLYAYLLFKEARPHLLKTMQERPELVTTREAGAAELQLRSYESEFISDRCANILSANLLTLAQRVDEATYLRAVPFRFIEKPELLERAKAQYAAWRERGSVQAGAADSEPPVRAADPQRQDQMIRVPIEPPTSEMLDLLPPPAQQALGYEAQARMHGPDRPNADYVAHMLALRRGVDYFMKYLDEAGFATAFRAPVGPPSDGAAANLGSRISLENFSAPRQGRDRLYHTGNSWMVSVGRTMVSDLALLENRLMLDFWDCRDHLLTFTEPLEQALSAYRATRGVNMLSSGRALQPKLEELVAEATALRAQQTAPALAELRRMGAEIVQGLELLEALQAEAGHRLSEIDEALGTIAADLDHVSADLRPRLEAERELLQEHRTTVQGMIDRMKPEPELERALETFKQADELLRRDGVSLIGVPPVAGN